MKRLSKASQAQINGQLRKAVAQAMGEISPTDLLHARVALERAGAKPLSGEWYELEKADEMLIWRPQPDGVFKQEVIRGE